MNKEKLRKLVEVLMADSNKLEEKVSARFLAYVIEAILEP